MGSSKTRHPRLLLFGCYASRPKARLENRWAKARPRESALRPSRGGRESRPRCGTKVRTRAEGMHAAPNPRSGDAGVEPKAARGLKARSICWPVCIRLVPGFQPFLLGGKAFLGRCPRLVWCRAFGPPSRRSGSTLHASTLHVSTLHASTLQRFNAPTLHAPTLQRSNAPTLHASRFNARPPSPLPAAP